MIQAGTATVQTAPTTSTTANATTPTTTVSPTTSWLTGTTNTVSRTTAPIVRGDHDTRIRGANLVTPLGETTAAGSDRGISQRTRSQGVGVLLGLEGVQRPNKKKSTRKSTGRSLNQEFLGTTGTRTETGTEAGMDTDLHRPLRNVRFHITDQPGDRDQNEAEISQLLSEIRDSIGERNIENLVPGLGAGLA